MAAGAIIAKATGPAKGLATSYGIFSGTGLAVSVGAAAGALGAVALMTWSVTAASRYIVNNATGESPMAFRVRSRTKGDFRRQGVDAGVNSIPVESPWDSVRRPVETRKRGIRIRVETPWEWAWRSVNSVVAKVRPIHLPFGYSL